MSFSRISPGAGGDGYITTVHTGTGGSFNTTEVGYQAPYNYPAGYGYPGYDEVQAYPPASGAGAGGNWLPGDWSRHTTPNNTRLLASEFSCLLHSCDPIMQEMSQMQRTLLRFSRHLSCVSDPAPRSERARSRGSSACLLRRTGKF